MEVEMQYRHDTQHGDGNKPLQQNKTSERTTSKSIVGAYKKHMCIHECAFIHVLEACVAVPCNRCDCNYPRRYTAMKAYHICPPHSNGNWACDCRGHKGGNVVAARTEPPSYGKMKPHRQRAKTSNASEKNKKQQKKNEMKEAKEMTPTTLTVRWDAAVKTPMTTLQKTT